MDRRSQIRWTESRKKERKELDSLIAQWTARDSPYGIMYALQEVGVAAPR